MIMMFESDCLWGIRSLVSSGSVLPVSLAANSSLLIINGILFKVQ